MQKISNIYCPINRSYFEICDVAELDFLTEYLISNTVNTEQIAFPRGTVTKDQRLDLCKQNIGAEGCKLVCTALENNTFIKNIMLGANGILNEGATALTELIEKNHKIKVAYLGCNGISEKGIKNLCEVLEKTDHLEALWLKRNPIGYKGAEYLTQMLKTNTSLRVLDVENTQLGEEGLMRIIKSLINDNRTLERLHIGGNNASAKIAKLLGILLRENPKIKALYSNVNFFHNEGFTYILQGLNKNATLEELSVASNNIRSSSTNLMVDILQKNSSLRWLDLGYSPSTKILSGKANKIGDIGAKNIASILRKNKALCQINLTKNQITSHGIHLILEALSENKTIQKIHLGKKISKKNKSLLARYTTANLSNKEKWIQHCDIQAIKSVYRTKAK
ncbi:ribonuclease inhibitor [Candidatus Uabimicrobium sp. HlEnr_7]|uniref:ribonuclease inhibitor n=1 Tax=Candidatus Uabimicrobium helgolandensis TaxID=3095367 RepID=UPI003558B0CF